MKKHLVILPIMAGLLLSGCEITLFGKTIRIGGGGDDKNVELPENFKMEYEGYKLATSIKDGGQYILGVYRVNENIMRFADGNYHSDAKGEYSFYLGTSTEVSEAAVVEAKSLGNGEFSLQMKAKGKKWHNKYIGIYPAVSGFDNYVMSIAPLDSLDQTSFTVTNKKETKTVEAQTQTHFKYYESFDDSPAYTVAAMYKHEEKNDEEAVPKFIGTGHNGSEGEDDYTSMDCKSYEEALSLEAYDLAHLYEKK